jgi:hypothetical protein
MLGEEPPVARSVETELQLLLNYHPNRYGSGPPPPKVSAEAEQLHQDIEATILTGITTREGFDHRAAVHRIIDFCAHTTSEALKQRGLMALEGWAICPGPARDLAHRALQQLAGTHPPGKA